MYNIMYINIVELNLRLIQLEQQTPIKSRDSINYTEIINQLKRVYSFILFFIQTIDNTISDINGNRNQITTLSDSIIDISKKNNEVKEETVKLIKKLNSLEKCIYIVLYIFKIQWLQIIKRIIRKSLMS